MWSLLVSPGLTPSSLATLFARCLQTACKGAGPHLADLPTLWRSTCARSKQLLTNLVVLHCTVLHCTAIYCNVLQGLRHLRRIDLCNWLSLLDSHLLEGLGGAKGLRQLMLRGCWKVLRLIFCLWSLREVC